jgi:hypothetical protein
MPLAPRFCADAIRVHPVVGRQPNATKLIKNAIRFGRSRTSAALLVSFGAWKLAKFLWAMLAS